MLLWIRDEKNLLHICTLETREKKFDLQTFVFYNVSCRKPKWENKMVIAKVIATTTKTTKKLRTASIIVRRKPANDKTPISFNHFRFFFDHIRLSWLI